MIHGPATFVSLEGAVAYLEEDLRAAHGGALTVLSRGADRITVDLAIDEATLAANPYFGSVELPLGAPSDRDRWMDLIRAALDGGILAGLVGEEPVRFRVGEIGPQRWDVRDQLERDLGWVNAPGDWHVNLQQGPDGVGLQVGSLHTSARFGPLVRLPASTTPVLSAVLCRLAKVEDGCVVLDPFCGAGTNLVQAPVGHGDRRPTGVRVIGTDVSGRAVAASAANLATRGVDGHVLRADAARLPLADGSVDRVVSNIPFGKRIGSHADNQTLYPAFLRELARVLAPKGRIVLLTEDKRLLKESIQRTKGLRQVKEVGFATGGAHPSAYVLTPGRSGRSR
ncbi:MULTISPECIES: methyltransferase domain-containing protein [unclassified Janibacter]|uniref:methyltransferase domain-containing protein n=1 Tax=unclassified Janibacter TaxID=2649294 RepID=UPI003D030774